MKPDHESIHRTLSQNRYRRDSTSTELSFASQMKIITLRRRSNNMPLGFSIRGGWEHGTGIFVSEVQSGSIAQRQGLRVGDQIVRINGFSIHRAIHMEVLSLLKTCPGVVLKIRRVGILPVKEKRKDPITWKLVDSHSMLSHVTNDVPSITEYLTESSIIVKIDFTVPGSTSLGCSIAKGPPEMPGIFMCTIKEGSLAESAGLEVGDQIIDMNGTSFFDIKLPDAVALMKAAKDIKLTVKKGAGICLFTEQNSQDSSSLLESQENKVNGSVSSSKTLSRQNDTLKDHAFSASSSSKSEDSSFQSSTASSDSEKDYSISEESGIHSLKPNQNTLKNGRHKKSASVATTASGSSEDTSRIEDSWLIKEKKKLEEEQRKLEIEKQRLEEEKRRLKQLAKSTSDVSSSLQSEDAPKGGGFLEELQKKAAKMSFKDDKTSIDQLILDRKQCDSRRSSTVLKGDEKKNIDEDIKKRQHELLMEEFRQAHRKMFGQQELSLPVANGTNSQILTKQPPLSCTKSAPPIPVSKNHKYKITINGQNPGNHSQTLPRPERTLAPALPKASVDDLASSAKQNSSINGHQINFRVTFDTKRSSTNSTEFNPSSKGTLVQVKPWTTRL